MLDTATAIAPAGHSPGTRFAGRYLLLDKLGAGGMGAVYHVKDEVGGKTLAFKHLLAEALHARATASTR